MSRAGSGAQSKSTLITFFASKKNLSGQAATCCDDDDRMGDIQSIVMCKLNELNQEQSRLEFPAKIRLQLLKVLIGFDPESPEKIQTALLAKIFKYDYDYFILTVSSWERNEKNAVLENIKSFFINIDFDAPMSFQEHARCCFFLSALASGVAANCLELAYTRQIKTMVFGTIAPSGVWTIKEELDNQQYTKYLYHVSSTGLIDVPTMNQAAAFRVRVPLIEKDHYYTVGFIAAACGEYLEFDGVQQRVS